MKYEIVCAIFMFCGVFFLFLMPIVKRMDDVDYDTRKTLGKVGIDLPDFKAKVKKSLVGIVSKVLGPEKYYHTKVSMMQAGIEGKDPDIVYFAGIVMAVVMAVLASSAFARADGSIVILIGVAAVAGFKLPEVYISSRAEQRKKKIQASVLTYTELLYTACEAGLELDYAVRRISDAQHNELSQEFRRTWNEFKQKGRKEAIKDMTTRCNTKDVSLLLEAITQTFETGTPMAQTLRDQASRIRQNAKNRVLEKGQKASVKMLLPMFAFELPSFLLVIGIPIAINFLKIIQQN